jgi:hypothetical protein
MRSNRTVGLGVLLGATSAIVFLTLLPVDPGSSLTEGECCGLTDIVLNILLFVPLGVGLALLGTGALAAGTIGAVASTAVELAQRWIPGRVSSVQDVVTNCLGTLLGALLVVGWTRRAHWWRTVGALQAGVMIATSVAGGSLVLPARPAPGTWWGFWAHELGGNAVFQGRVLRFNLQGVDIPDGPLPNGAELSARLATGDPLLLAATLVSGPPVDGRAQLVGIMAEQSDYLELWQEGRSLLAFVRLRLTGAGLRPVWYRLDDALPAVPGDTVALSLRVTRRGVVVASTFGKTRRGRTFDLSAPLFWAGFLPFEVRTSSPTPLWALLPMAVAFAGLGMGVRHRIGLALGAATAFFGGMLLARGAPPPWPALAAAALGLWAGRVLARRLGLDS